MNFTWLIESEAFQDGNPEKLANIIKSKGMNVEMVDYQYVVRDLVTKSQKDFDSSIIPYGSIQFAKQAQIHAPCCIYNDFKNLECISYYGNWKNLCLQFPYAIIPWGDLPRITDQCYKDWKCDSLFIRPNNGFKSFTGQEIEKDYFDTWYTQENELYKHSNTMLVVVSFPQLISAEWRLVVIDRKIITLSRYDKSIKLPVSSTKDDVIGFAKNVIEQDWQPMDVYTLDICETFNDETLHVLEIGSLNCSALYDCDLEKIVDSLTNYIKNKEKEEELNK